MRIFTIVSAILNILLLLTIILVIRIDRIETTFAPGYTRETFDSVSCGMEESEVLRLLGPPLSQGNYDDSTYLRYSEAKGSGNYEMRLVILGKDGRVKKIIENVYFD